MIARLRCIQRPAAVLACWVGLVACVGPAGAQEPIGAKRPLAILDLYLFDNPQSVVLAADETFVIYVRQWVDAGTQQERQSLWRAEGDGIARPLEEGEPDARSPVLSPDGRWIAFRSTRPCPEGFKQTPSVPPESDAATEVWLIRAAGGPAVPLAGPDKPYGRVFNDAFYGRVAFSPDGRRLAFVADDGRDPRTFDQIAADVYLVEPDQGEGYTGYGPAQIWVADLLAPAENYAAGRIQRLTDDHVWYGDPQWSPDGRWLAVHANKTKDRESVRFSINKNYDLWAIDVVDAAQSQLAAGPGPEVSPRWSPDGQRLACLSLPRKGPHADVFNLALVGFGPPPAGPAALDPVFDHHGRDEYDPADPYPLFPLPDDCWDGPDALIYTAAKGTDTATMRADLPRGLRRPVVPGGSQDEASNSRYVRRERVKLRLTPPGNLFLRDRLPGETRTVSWTNDQGMTLEGVLTLPPSAVAAPPYKLVLFPHGGPHSRSTAGFNFTAEVFAAQGYAVFQPNFRGSAGYGRKFLDADRGDFGGGDMRDITSGIDHLVTQGLVDPQRQFVYGVSYGGFLTCWLVGHTNQFRAAVAQNAVTDLGMMWGLSDLQSWTEWEFGGLPWEVPDAMRRHSPLAYVADVRTPTLILHSREDRRCPIAMGKLFHQSLRARGVATQMVVYPHEGHAIRQPRHREDVLRRTLAWFDRHDKR